MTSKAPSIKPQAATALRMIAALISAVIVSLLPVRPCLAGQPHTFTFGGPDNFQFLLDGKPFQIRGGEMHPGRIPPAYWRHRIRMAKAMGLNTISFYMFWNDHEREEGTFDFTTGSRDIGKFLRICQEEGMWVLLRPGPYVCGEWDLGGLPYYLLRDPTMKLRRSDPRYKQPAERYLRAVANVVRPYLRKNGGPILMIQVENEFGSYYGQDRPYLEWIRDVWISEGIDGPFNTADGASEYYLNKGVLPGAAVGLDAGTEEKHWEVARKMNPGVPVFSAETYPGWMRHWGNVSSWRPTDVTAALTFYMKEKKSFSLYVFHGGTSFGFTAGANAFDKVKYAPDLTSYDYGAPLDEQGNPTPAYHKYRQLLESYLPAGETLPEIPAPIPTMAIPAITVDRWTTLWDSMPAAVEAKQTAYFESALLNQNQGIVIYRTTLPDGPAGKLEMDQRDFAQVFLDGKQVGTLNRAAHEHSLELPAREKPVTLDILVEAMGHINFRKAMETDRKGLVGDVTLNEVPLSSWMMFRFPLKDDWIMSLPKASAADSRPGGVFKGTFNLEKVADTFLDMSSYRKGVLWVNGHNLGRFWHIGPQKRLYCPAPWLKKGENTVVILDLEASGPATVEGMTSYL